MKHSGEGKKKKRKMKDKQPEEKQESHEAYGTADKVLLFVIFK